MIECCIHIANVCYLISFLHRDMLWLRILTCVGLVLGIVFFSCQPMPLYGPVAWHFVFLVINTIQIRCLILERRRLMLTPEQEQFGEETFRDLSREELLILLTRLQGQKPRHLRDIDEVCQQPLTSEERAWRDIAFSRLSRKELLNLLTRRLWNSLKRRNPIRWRRRVGTAPTVPEMDVARGPATS